ncbi:MAG: Lrp/AsnC family transcriptional regulator [Chloroflexota bacterium]|nr:Lrp/AsnC family transcriptional regulator [Chloroflexota bacterium]
MTQHESGDAAGVVALDDVDRRLLHRLAEDLRPDLAEVARDIGTSAEDAAARFDRLRAGGVIAECVAKLDPPSVGVGLTAFLMVRLAQTGDDYDVARRMFADLEAVEEAHAVSGEFDWVLKVRASSLAEIQHVVTQRLSFVPGFVRAQTWMVLDTACDTVNADRVRLVGQ